LIDNNGICHVAFGVMRILKDDPNANGVSFFPATSGLAYWNETMKDVNNQPLCPNIIIDVEDRDNSGTVFDDLTNIDQIAAYYISLTSQPSMGIDANGTLYMAYSALMEGTNNGNGQYYRNVHIMKSSDNGANWSIPLNVTNDDFSEGVFASVAKNVGADVHLIYQRDSEPGLAVRGDQDPFVQNEIVYARIPVGDIPSTPNGINIPYCGDAVPTGIANNITSKVNSLQVFPNPTNGMLNISYISEVNGDVNVRLVNINGQEVMNQSFNKANGEFFNVINMDNFAKGVYMLQVITPERTITEKVISY
ncbi:MAG: T9SS type A sorting domain-containing protein, partial [Bacteroidia bacterium]